MDLCMGGVQPAWPGGGDMGSWPVCLLVKLLMEGTICILADAQVAGSIPIVGCVGASQSMILSSLMFLSLSFSSSLK